MRGGSDPYRVLAWFALAAIAAGCAPLNGANSGAGASGMCASSLVSAASDAFPSDQIQINGNSGVAQSFLLSPNNSVTAVSLRLEAFSSTSTNTLTGSLTVSIVKDVNSGSSAKTPNCLASSGGSGCATVASATGTLSLGSISLFQPTYYNIPLSSAVTTPTTSAAQVFWIVATAGYAPSTTDYVAWDGGSFIGNPLLALTASTSGLGTSNWATQNQNMTFQVCH